VNPNLIDANAARVMVDSALSSRDEARTNTFVIGLCFLGLIAVGIALLGQNHSSVDASYSLHVGAIPESPQSRPTVTPVVGQAVTADSSSTGPGWKS
jgi:hypothetical protein